MSVTTTQPTSAAPVFQKETTAGNYFVSNYPPFSFWKPSMVPELEAAMARPPAADTPLGLYVHIPFCRKRCHFCYFKVYTDKDSAAIRATWRRCWVRTGGMRSQPFIGGRKPQFRLFRRRHALLSVSRSTAALPAGSSASCRGTRLRR